MPVDQYIGALNTLYYIYCILDFLQKVLIFITKILIFLSRLKTFLHKGWFVMKRIKMKREIGFIPMKLKKLIMINLSKKIIKKIIVGPSESMSKSKKNTVDPEVMISKYGADAVRWFILSDSPPEKMFNGLIQVY